MKAGRELDALVAEKVIGRDMTKPPGFKYPIGLPHYSTNIADAWKIVRHFSGEREFWVTVTTGGMPGQGASCSIQEYEREDDHKHVGPEFVGIGWDAPEAICLAALYAMAEREQPGLADAVRYVRDVFASMPPL